MPIRTKPYNCRIRVIDFESILKARKKAGLEYYFVEDEQEDDPFGNLKADFDYVNSAKIYQIIFNRFHISLGSGPKC